METRIRRILNDNGQIIDKNKDQKEDIVEEIIEETKKEDKKTPFVLKDDGYIPEISNRASARVYTQITNASRDKCTVRILKQLANGVIGEFSDTAKYWYQHLITGASNANLSNALQGIFVQEMRHLQLLLKAIIAFGGLPTYTAANGNFWNARFVNYNTNPIVFLRQNILAEERAIANYQRAINLVTNESLKALFAEIIEDEREHINILKGFLV